MTRALIVSLIVVTSTFGCSIMLNSNLPNSTVATPAALMQADRDFATATHARGIDGWMSFFARDAIRIPYGRGSMVKGYNAVRRFDEPGIAERLGISDQTVKFHVASISGKLGAANRTDAVRLAVRRGLITL